MWVIKIEIASWISDGALISDSPFFHSFPITHDHLSISPLFPRPHLIIGAPDLRRERAVRQKTSCLSRRKAVSYLSFSEQAAVGSMMRCSLDLFCILFCIKAKKHVGFGATPQESMDNAQCTIDWFDDLSIYWWIPIIWGLRVFAPSWRIKVLPFRQVSDGGLMPQNKFCGYENPAFQAKKNFQFTGSPLPERQ